MPHRTPISPARVLLLAALGAPLSCDDASATNACDAYVAYMCDCHALDFDCGQLENTYANPDSADLDSCRLALDDQEAADAADSGFTCSGAAAG